MRAAVAAGAEIVELRVDMLRDIPAVETLLSQPHDVPFILTIRSASEGGHWDGGDDERIALLLKLGLLLPGYVDIELAAWQRSANLRQKIGLICEVDAAAHRHRNALVISHHDLRHTPGDLTACFDQLAATPAAVIKAVFTARDATDACRVLAEQRRHTGRRDVTALAMGEAGLITRVLAPKFGTALSFAAIQRGEESAPGQPTIAELRGLYRWDSINAKTGVYGVVGWPVAHSLGPRLHNAAMASDGIDGVYVPLPVAPGVDDFMAFMDYLDANDWLDVRGLSVTIPHKERALRWLQARGGVVSGICERCGAVNTLTRTVDGWRGDNTDAAGVIAALATQPGLQPDQLAGRRFDVIGAGGVARAVVAALIEHGAAVTIYNRTSEKADALARQMGCAWEPWDDRDEVSGEVLINCTSVGMSPAIDASPVPSSALHRVAVVFDTIYTPERTRLLREAEKAGCGTVSGVPMFIGQAEAQYSLWHGRTPPTGLMGRVLAGLHA